MVMRASNCKPECFSPFQFSQLAAVSLFGKRKAKEKAVAKSQAEEQPKGKRTARYVY